jgi:hypothetical protein
MGRTTRSKGVLTDQTNVRHKSVEQAPKKIGLEEPPKKICVYQLKETVAETANDDEMDVYHFEFDSKMEPKKKIKKRRARPQKTAVKRLNTNAKITSRNKNPQKKKKSPKPAVRQVAFLSPLVHSTPTRHALANISTNFEAHVPAALRKDPMSINKAVVISSPSMSAPPTPIHKAPMSPIYQTYPSPIHQIETSRTHHDITDNSVPLSPQNSLSRPDSPPLANLFDDDEDESLILPRKGPTRFEYNEIATARARVIRTSITPRDVVRLPQQPPRDRTPEPVGPKMKQTSILKFVKAPEEEGLFGSFSPIRASSPMQLSMLSPVRADAENTRQSASENEEEEEDEERCAPTRLSANTLRNVLQANKETLAKEMPPSPKRRFFKVGSVFP